ncbi:MAG: hypothetical protein H6548_11130 [Chitinophagales bacterium]|nr:hypothetical protein [Chitinophagales bacterium]HQU38649.1 hypothetical protein [Chitinophagales bacterium]HQU75771.1 hypothetical protein [Chitinophagales bacterium]
MIQDIRRQYNGKFTQEAYDQFFRSLWEHFHQPIEFKVCETPVFVPEWLRNLLIQAGEEVIDTLVQPGFKEATEASIPDHLRVPGEDDHTTFLAIDFGICKVGDEILPQLIEMQGFASLYGHQHAMARGYRRFFDIPGHMSHLFSLEDLEYEDLLRRTLLGDHKAENVILLDIEPNKQKTWVDFWDTKFMTGIEPVCITELHRSGNDLWYERDGQKINVHRIYDRLIFDELEARKDLRYDWNKTEPVNVEWVSHPNWFFRISKYTMPMLRSRFVPETHFVHELPVIPDDLENYVLKPLFSFAGAGVKFDVQRDDISSLEHPEHFILQKKVQYEPVIQTPDVPAKFEVRMMYIWEKDSPRPRLVINLVRLSKGVMIGVNFNKNKDWVGGSVGFFE